jgi:hypothetical protein
MEDTKKNMNDETMNIMIAAKEDFEKEIMPKTRQAIKEMIAEADPEFIKVCRIEYLGAQTEDLSRRKQRLVFLYEEAARRDCAAINRIYLGHLVIDIDEQIKKLEVQIKAMSNPDKSKNITEDMIQRAKDHPFVDLLEFKKNKTNCPFHEDKTPSAHLYEKDNHVHCFSCHRNFDTIDFIQERDGLSWADAVKYLGG